MRKVIDKYASLPFSYGVDCARFAAECVEAVRGDNPIADLDYSSEREAYKVIKQYDSLEGALRFYLGDPYGGHKDGDVCLLDDNKGRDVIGVIYRGRVVARVKGGLMDYPLGRAKRIWCI